MTILVNINLPDAPLWTQLLHQHLPDCTLVSLDRPHDPAAVEYAVTWAPELGAFLPYANLRGILSIGAGVDNLLRDPDLPQVPVVRSVAPDLTSQMREWVLLQVLSHHRNALGYSALQARRDWAHLPGQRPAHQVRIGIMGLGELGLDAAHHLGHLGFDIAGWSRAPKPDTGFPVYSGSAGMAEFLGRSEILISLLPLTPLTKGILNKTLLAQLPPGAVLINAGRGGLQVEADILAALDTGQLRGASLDVFEQEPLPASSPLWSHPAVVVTPHVAVYSTPATVVPALVAQIRRHQQGGAFQNVVDRANRY